MSEITPVSELSKPQPVALEEVVDLADGCRQPLYTRLVEEFGPQAPAAKRTRKSFARGVGAWRVTVGLAGDETRTIRRAS